MPVSFRGSWLTFLLGGLVGAGGALLMTPRTGRQNREEMSRAWERLRGHDSESDSQPNQRIFDALDTLSDRVLEILGNVDLTSEAQEAELLAAIRQAQQSVTPPPPSTSDREAPGNV